MHSKFFYIIALFVLMCCPLHAQTDTTRVVTDTVAVVMDTTEVVGQHVVTNTSALKLFFEKLYEVDKEKAGKINIVHIGDSHIQADAMTGYIRKALQDRFGNGGAGFVFPHRLAKTNGSQYVRFESNTSWASRRNIYAPEPGLDVGLSGIALKTRDRDFVVELTVRDSAYKFNWIKIITPQNYPLFDVATTSRTIVLESKTPKKITHKIKNGEVLGSIANKYGVSIAELRRANGLKGDNIRAGKTLKIPTDEMERKEVRRSEFDQLSLTLDPLANFYYSPKPLSKIYLLPNKGQSEFNLNGMVLEKDAHGILYHSIGVNGAKASDYNKYPLFFEQLPALMPDLVIVSLGTNESFDKLTRDEYTEQLNIFIAKIKAKNPDVCVLVMTPPPSLFRRRTPNTYAADYARVIQGQETTQGYASFDLFTEMGGLYGVPRNAKRGFINSDKVHYTQAGYEKQGSLFLDAFFKAYETFKTNRDK